MCQKHYYYNLSGQRVDTRKETCQKARRKGFFCDPMTKFRHENGEKPPYEPVNLPPSPPSSDASYIVEAKDFDIGRQRRYSYADAYIEPNSSRTHRAAKPSRPAYPFIVDPPATHSPPRNPEPPVGILTNKSSPTYVYQDSVRPSPSARPEEVTVEVNDPKLQRRSSRRQSRVYPDPLNTPTDTPRTSKETVDEKSRSSSSSRDIREGESRPSSCRVSHSRERSTESKHVRFEQAVEKEIRRQNSEIAHRPTLPRPRSASPVSNLATVGSVGPSKAPLSSVPRYSPKTSLTAISPSMSSLSPPIRSPTNRSSTNRIVDAAPIGPSPSSPVVTMGPPPSPRHMRYRRGSVVIRPPGDELNDKLEQLKLADERVWRREVRRQEQLERDEEDARRARLIARMTPQPQPVLRRPKVYEDVERHYSRQY